MIFLYLTFWAAVLLTKELFGKKASYWVLALNVILGIVCLPLIPQEGLFSFIDGMGLMLAIAYAGVYFVAALTFFVFGFIFTLLFHSWRKSEEEPSNENKVESSFVYDEYEYEDDEEDYEEDDDEEEEKSGYGGNSVVSYRYEVQSKASTNTPWMTRSSSSEEKFIYAAFDRVSEDSRYKHVRIVQIDRRSGKVVAVLGFR